MTPKPEYSDIIAQMDSTLLFLKGNWIASKPTDRDRWMEKINGALDERLKWMRLRDAK